MARKTKPAGSATTAQNVRAIVAALEALADDRIRDEMGPRYGIHVKDAFGVPMNAMQKLASRYAGDHALAAALWDAEVYEARIVASFVDDPAAVTPAQMDRWCRDFDNWGIVDTVCFKLFDRVPHAFAKVDQWATRKAEFEKRAAFALLASLALHRKDAADAEFLSRLALIEAAATDDRNFVKKGVSWALRSIGRRRGALNRESVALAKRLAASKDPTERWIGKDALRQFERG